MYCYIGTSQELKTSVSKPVINTSGKSRSSNNVISTLHDTWSVCEDDPFNSGLKSSASRGTKESNSTNSRNVGHPRESSSSSNSRSSSGSSKNDRHSLSHVQSVNSNHRSSFSTPNNDKDNVSSSERRQAGYDIKGTTHFSHSSNSYSRSLTSSVSPPRSNKDVRPSAVNCFQNNTSQEGLKSKLHRTSRFSDNPEKESRPSNLDIKHGDSNSGQIKGKSHTDVSNKASFQRQETNLIKKQEIERQIKQIAPPTSMNTSLQRPMTSSVIERPHHNPEVIRSSIDVGATVKWKEEWLQTYLNNKGIFMKLREDGSEEGPFAFMCSRQACQRVSKYFCLGCNWTWCSNECKHFSQPFHSQRCSEITKGDYTQQRTSLKNRFFYKTCKFFKKQNTGGCKLGHNCEFLHSRSQTRSLPIKHNVITQQEAVINSTSTLTTSTSTSVGKQKEKTFNPPDREFLSRQRRNEDRNINFVRGTQHKEIDLCQEEEQRDIIARKSSSVVDEGDSKSENVNKNHPMLARLDNLMLNEYPSSSSDASEVYPFEYLFEKGIYPEQALYNSSSTQDEKDFFLQEFKDEVEERASNFRKDSLSASKHAFEKWVRFLITKELFGRLTSSSPLTLSNLNATERIKVFQEFKSSLGASKKADACIFNLRRNWILVAINSNFIDFTHEEKKIFRASYRFYSFNKSNLNEHGSSSSPQSNLLGNKRNLSPTHSGSPKLSKNKSSRIDKVDEVSWEGTDKNAESTNSSSGSKFDTYGIGLKMLNNLGTFIPDKGLGKLNSGITDFIQAGEPKLNKRGIGYTPTINSNRWSDPDIVSRRILSPIIAASSNPQEALSSVEAPTINKSFLSIPSTMEPIEVTQYLNSPLHLSADLAHHPFDELTQNINSVQGSPVVSSYKPDQLSIHSDANEEKSNETTLSPLPEGDQASSIIDTTVLNLPELNQENSKSSSSSTTVFELTDDSPIINHTHPLHGNIELAQDVETSIYIDPEMEGLHRLTRHVISEELLINTTVRDLSNYLFLQEKELSAKSVKAQNDQLVAFEKWLIKEDLINEGESPLLIENFTQMDRTIIISKYMTYLYSEEGGEYSGNGLSAIMSTLGGNWTTVGKESLWSANFGEIARRRIKKAFSPSQDQVAINKIRKRKQDKECVVPEMIEAARKLFWETSVSKEGVPDADTLDNMGIYIGIAIGYEIGCRMCAFIKTVNDINRVKLRDFRIKVGAGCYDEQTEKFDHYQYLVGKEIADYFQDNDQAKYQSIIGLEIDLNRTKTVAVKDITILTRTETEKELISDVITYIIHSRNLDENSFLTSFRETGPVKNRKITRKEITGKQLVSGLKASAIELDLDPSVFSLSSLRKGMASTLRNTILIGESEQNNLDNTFKRGGWKKNSSVPDKHYNMNRSSVESNKATRDDNANSSFSTQSYGPAGVRNKEDSTQLLALRERLKNRSAAIKLTSTEEVITKCVQCLVGALKVKCEACKMILFCSKKCQSNSFHGRENCKEGWRHIRLRCFHKGCIAIRDNIDDPVYYCEICFKAEYCSAGCKNRDLEAHQLVCGELVEETLNERIKELNSEGAELIPPDGNWRIAAREMTKVHPKVINWTETVGELKVPVIPVIDFWKSGQAPLFCVYLGVLVKQHCGGKKGWDELNAEYRDLCYYLQWVNSLGLTMSVINEPVYFIVRIDEELMKELVSQKRGAQYSPIDVTRRLMSLKEGGITFAIVKATNLEGEHRQFTRLEVLASKLDDSTCGKYNFLGENGESTTVKHWSELLFFYCDIYKDDLDRVIREGGLTRKAVNIGITKEESDYIQRYKDENKRTLVNGRQRVNSISNSEESEESNEEGGIWIKDDEMDVEIENEFKRIEDKRDKEEGSDYSESP